MAKRTRCSPINTMILAKLLMIVTTAQASTPSYSFYSFGASRAFNEKPESSTFQQNSNQHDSIHSGFNGNNNAALPDTTTVIKHPGTCSFDRSHTACTFSLLCYLASGVPIEGCDQHVSMTCCHLQSNKLNILLLNNKQASAPPIHQISGLTLQTKYHEAPEYFSASSFSKQQSRNSTKNDLSEQVKPSLETMLTSKQQFTDSRLRNGKFNMVELSEYGNNAIRRSRTEKIMFQEVTPQKSYSRYYNVEEMCGKPMAKPRSRIIGGQDAYFGEFPWQVDKVFQLNLTIMIEKFVSPTHIKVHIKITKHQCGGALVSSRFIVTAAHCIYQAPMHQLNVIIGAHDIEDARFQDIPPQYFSVAKVILHPNFRFSASHPDRYDVALVELDNPVHFSDSVLPVCLPDENIHLEGRKAVVTGWGKTDPALSNRYGTRLLQKVDVPIIDNGKCENWHQTRGIDLRIFSEMMCAGYENGQKDACVGDSGGPLVIDLNGRWTLAGITSAGFGCAQSRQPGIYHRVSHTVAWIRQTVRDEETENSQRI